MADTYTQIYIQIVFAVKGRGNLISEPIRDELQKYFTGMIHDKGHRVLAIYCMPDHTHILVRFSPDCNFSEFVKLIKSATTRFINDRGWFRGHFSWQNGFGAFSYSNSQVDQVINYILNQPAHHKKSTFRDEYLAFLEKFQISFNEKYLFDFYENDEPNPTE